MAGQPTRAAFESAWSTDARHSSRLTRRASRQSSVKGDAPGLGGDVMRPRKLVAAAAAVALGLSWALAACSSQGTSGGTPANSAVGARIAVAMVTHGQAFDPFWGLVKKGAQQAADDFNVALSYQAPSTTSPQAQAALITQAAAKKPNAMVVTIPDAPVLAPPIRQVTSSGTPVVVVNVGDRVYKQAGALAFAGSSPPAAARCRCCTSTAPSCIRRRARSSRR